MNSSDKWFFGLIGAIIIVPLLGMGVSEYLKYQCRIEAIKAGKNIEDTIKLCGKPV